MKVLLSPTKKQTMKEWELDISIPPFINEAKELIEMLISLGKEEYRKILSASDYITNESWDRLLNWSSKGCTPAIMAFTGEAFSSLDPATFNLGDLEYAQDKLRIFSALYGILTPLSAINHYRLDMLNNLKLYDFWSKKITEYLIDDLKDDNFLIDLSSKEYSKIVNFKALDIKVITPDFKTRTDKGLKTIAIWSKRMRGLMTREIIKNRVQTEEDLQNLKIGEYKLEEINNGHYLYIK